MLQQPVLGQDANFRIPVRDGPSTQDHDGVVSGQMVDQPAHALKGGVVSDFPEEGTPVLLGELTSTHYWLPITNRPLADLGILRLHPLTLQALPGDVVHPRSAIGHRAVEVHDGNWTGGATAGRMAIYK